MAKHDPNLNALFQALSDPTRRGMIQRLMAGPASVGELAEPLDMALPTVMKHLDKLQDANLVRTEKHGRTRVCQVNVAAIDMASEWLSRLRRDWTGRLDRLESYLDQRLEGTPPAPSEEEE